MRPVIQAEGLVKRFGDVEALTGVDLAVPEGTVFGLLGPNGAGKTTVVSILSTLLLPDAGSATVAGVDVLREPHEVRRRIGLSGQYAALDEALTGYENLEMIGQLYHLGKKRAQSRADELLARFDLVEAGRRQVKTYSGGMRRRLDLAGALVAEPPVLFLDEPTTGLDPRSRIELWGVIRELVAQGSTLLLTTQYLEEADQLADEIMVIDHGRRIAQGTPDELKVQVGGERIDVQVAEADDLPTVQGILAQVGTGDAELHPATRRVQVPVNGGVRSLSAVVRELEATGIEIVDIGLRRPTLDDVFLTLTGHVAEVSDDGDPPAATDGIGPADQQLEEVPS